MTSLFAGLAAALMFAVACQADPSPDQAQIQHLLMTTFDKPGNRLQVAPVSVVGDHAVAGWVQAERGGRALLRRKHGKWTLILCSGDSLKDAKHLEQAGIALADARALARLLTADEARLPARHVALLSTFEGTVMMDESGGHPPHGAHGTGAHGTGAHGAHGAPARH